MDDSTCHCHYRGYTDDAGYVVIGTFVSLVSFCEQIVK